MPGMGPMPGMGGPGGGFMSELKKKQRQSAIPQLVSGIHVLGNKLHVIESGCIS